MNYDAFEFIDKVLRGVVVRGFGGGGGLGEGLLGH